MNRIPVILIFDVGKTNKKIFLFDEQYNIVYEKSEQLPEIKDEDGFPCEDVDALTNWIKKSFALHLNDEKFEIKAVNFSAYGASFVYIDKNGKEFLPLYNYLKPYPQDLQKKFYEQYGNENLIAQQTASPVLGNLNSGMQVYRLKHERPEAFAKIKYALHLPQYLSYLLTDYPATEITSIGCHTSLWDFKEQCYHRWVNEEEVEKLFAPVLPSATVIPFVFENKNIISGIGLHDSSAALIPYLASVTEPFILISTGTWSISLNPFNDIPLTDEELRQDCLCYLSYEAKPVKASRLFAGHEHDQEVKRLAEHFKTSADQYKNVKPDFELLKKIRSINTPDAQSGKKVNQSEFGKRDLAQFKNYDKAYHQLIVDIMVQQVRSTNLVIRGSSVKKIFVDGGFSNNPIYMYLLAEAYPGIEVYAASIAQSSALGAALAIHQSWNKQGVHHGIIKLKFYSPNLRPLD